MVSKEKKDRIMKKAMSVIKVRTKDDGIINDVLGSYTGTPVAPHDERPVQDQDDL